MNQINIQGVDFPYQLKRSKGRQIRFRYLPKEHLIMVNIPKGVTQITVKELLLEQKDWIWKQYKKERIVVQKEGYFLLFGKEYPIIHKFGIKKGVVLKEDGLYLTFTKPLTVAQYQKWLRTIQKEYLSQYIESIREEVEKKTKIENVTYHYRLMTSRFGSCFPNKKEIHLNLYLLALPKECIQAVLYHEYAHFYQQNHRKEFYQVLNEFYPSYQEVSKILKKVSFK
ncbi:MAG: DUF45 domain-containing protein [Erysipelotrichaceae bacterium]|nr:DUF45 domain-containing protein [Erysipelotrichaceae bacterium]